MRAECIRMASISRSRVKRSLLLVRSTTPRTISWTRRVDHSWTELHEPQIVLNIPPTSENLKDKVDFESRLTQYSKFRTWAMRARLSIWHKKEERKTHVSYYRYHLNLFSPKALFVHLKPTIRFIINHQEAWRTKSVDYIIFKTISKEK